MSKVSSADDKRLRREIANSNERRRMQSINAGFISLRQLLPLSEGEKLSKAAILQLTSKYINVLSQEKSRLLQQNNKLKELLQQQQASSSCNYPPPARASTVVDDLSVTNAPSGDSLQPVGYKEPLSRPLQRPPVSLNAPPTGALVAEPPVTNVAHEVTVGSDVSSLSFKNEQPLATASSTSAAPARVSVLADAAQMNLPLRKRKRTYSLSVESTGAPTTGKAIHTHAQLDSLLSVSGCARQADAVGGTSTDDGGDTDADGNSAAPSSTCRTLPRDVTTSATASDAEGVALTTDRYRFVPSAPLPTGSYSAMFDSRNEADNSPSQTQFAPLGAYSALANSVVLGPAATYGGAMLVSANATSQQRNTLFTSPPFRLDMITSVQPTSGMPLLLSAASCRQRLDSFSFVNANESATASAGSYRSVVSPPVSCSSGVRQSCETTTSITKKNLETIFEAIRHVEGEDLSLGESPCASAAGRQQQLATAVDSNTPGTTSTMLMPFTAAADASQPPAAFFVCLSPANLALSPSHAASVDFGKQSPVGLAPNAAVQFSMNAAINTVMSPVSVANSASRFASRSAQPQLLVTAAGGDFESAPGVGLRSGLRAGQPTVACQSVLTGSYSSLS